MNVTFLEKRNLALCAPIFPIVSIVLMFIFILVIANTFSGIYVAKVKSLEKVQTDPGVVMK